MLLLPQPQATPITSLSALPFALQFTQLMYSSADTTPTISPCIINHITIRTFSSLGCICHYINIANCCHRCTIRHGQLLHTLKHHRSNAQSATFRIHFATIHINSYQPPHRLHNLASPAPSLLWLSQTQHLFHRNSLN